MLVTNIYNPTGISIDTIEQLKEFYYSGEGYETKTMKKLSGVSEDIKKILEAEHEIDVDRIAISHFYKHSKPYYPHTDYHSIEKENMVIPLEVIGGPNPYLIVFNQWYGQDGITWTFRDNLEFKHNTATKNRPCDSNIQDATGEDIPEYLYKYLSHQPKHYWFGLSGHAYEFKVGGYIRFDSKKIHATSKLKCESKLGLSIRYYATSI